MAHGQHPQRPRTAVTERIPPWFPAGQPLGRPAGRWTLRDGLTDRGPQVEKQVPAVEDRADALFASLGNGALSGFEVAAECFAD
jgi:hypothetical protein